MKQVEVKYAPGMRIIVRGEEWLVKKVETNSLGNQTLHVIGLSQLVKDYESMFLVDIEDDIEIVDPAKVTLVPDNSAFFRKSKVYIESQWRGKIPTDNKIHIGNKAAMDLMSYQLEPAQMALNKTRQRILIADTVGLGKTLEAGVLMSELIARGKGKRILVVTVKSMMTQFQKEMWNRFTIPLVRLDSSRIQSVRAKLPTNYNPFFYYDKTIISVDTLKNDLDYRTHLEHAWWDIIVIDEAHNVAKRGDRSSQRSKLASLLANRSDTLIMLTATPHEFQDFREHDYELIVKLSKCLKNILLVGDYYQHSVSGQNNSGKPFKKSKTEIGYEEFIEELRGERFDVDTKSLICTRRCSEEICSFIRDKLGIQIQSARINAGTVIRPSNIQEILDDKNIVKLVYDNASHYSFRAVNWSYSKGDTYDAVCVILNGSTEKLVEDKFSVSTLKTVTLNKLYVALTRSKGDLYIVTQDEFETVKEKYYK